MITTSAASVKTGQHRGAVDGNRQHELARRTVKQPGLVGNVTRAQDRSLLHAIRRHDVPAREAGVRHFRGDQ